MKKLENVIAAIPLCAVADARSDFIVDPDTDLIVRKEDQKLVSEVLDEEIALSPHWLQPSQGGGANPSPTGNVSNEAKFQQALKGNDFDAVLANAPRVQVR